MNPVIRPAQEADILPLSKLAEASYRAAFQTILGEEGLALRTASFFATRFGTEWPDLHLMEDQHKLLGFAQVRVDVLDMLFVAPTMTGRSLGTQLLKDSEARGARRLECFAKNTGARQFYENHGWQETGSSTREFAGRSCGFVSYAKPWHVANKGNPVV
jgi:putative acetyltransferase